MKPRIYWLFLPCLLFSSFLTYSIASNRSKKAYWLLMKERFNADRFKIKLKHSLKIDPSSLKLRRTREILKKASKNLDAFCKKHRNKEKYIIGGVSTSIFSVWVYALSKMSPEERREALLLHPHFFLNPFSEFDSKTQFLAYLFYASSMKNFW